MANVKIPYALVPAVALDQRRAAMKINIARALPRFERRPVDDARPIYLACFGPSLRETWEELKGKSPIIAMSGATKWLAERGIIADYALEMDPRESQLVVSLPPVPGVTYLVASCVCPAFFDQLAKAGNKTMLWHTVSSNYEDELKFVSQADPGALVVHGGSTVGLTAIHIGGMLGHTRFEIHGMDGSFGTDGVRHAGHHGGKEQPANITWAAGGVKYYTSKIMSNAVAESINTAKNYPIITVWHGKGLTQALIREANLVNACCADETDKLTKLVGLRPVVMKAPPLPIEGKHTFWDGIVNFLTPEDLPELVANIRICEPRRALARYNTGSIPFESSAYLRAICRFYKPTVIAEIGTFIGTSTLALKAGRVLYTCDGSNDCMPSTEALFTHPYQSSTQMFMEIQEKVDLFFFDGRIQTADLPHIQRLSHDGTVYVFDDFVKDQKGVANVTMMAALMPQRTLITPDVGPSRLAVALPFVEHAEKNAR